MADSRLNIDNKALLVLNYLLAAAAVMAILLPIYIIFSLSLKTNDEYLNKSIMSLPDNILNFRNYIDAIREGRLLSGFSNTMILVVVGVAGRILFGTMAAYVLDRFRFKFRNLILSSFVVATLVPTVLTSVSTFMVIKALHIFNTRMAGFVLYGAVPDIVSVYLFIQYMNGIPHALDESATVDGANYFRIYWSIILPQLKPAMATAAILTTLSIYNDFLVPYLFMPKSTLRTVATALNTFSSDKATNWTVMSAAIFAILIPTIIIYLALQRFIISGITDGSVKA